MAEGSRTGVRVTPAKTDALRVAESQPGDGADTADPGQEAPPAKRRSRRRLLEDAGLVVIAIVAAILVRAFVAQAYYIPSASMLPQLQINDRVVVSRLAYHLHPVHRGDIVVFKAPPGVGTPSKAPSNPLGRLARSVGVALGLTEDQTVLIKRVIALPGETVSAQNGTVYINGDRLVEPYLPKGTVTSSFGPTKIPSGTVWVMGDNRGDSEDSRVFGPIRESWIVGRAIWKVWPPWRASFL